MRDRVRPVGETPSGIGARGVFPKGAGAWNK